MENFKASRDEVTGMWELSGVPHWEKTYSNFVEDLKANKAFKFSRFGDGEWNCIFNKVGQNVDGHKYFPDLGNALRRVILSKPEYILGMQPLSMSYDRSEQIKEFCRNMDIKWVNADVLHNASITKQLNKFLSALQGRYVILVGPAHLSSFFPECVHIVTLPVDCWLEYKAIRQQIEFHIDGVNNAVVLFAASMMANVLVDDFADRPHTFIDIGSVLDPYCNIFSRRYHHKLFK